MKTCSSCREDKPVDAYGRNASMKDGFQHQCRACRSAHYARNADKIKQAVNEYRRANHDVIRDRQAQYRAVNAETLATKQREYAARNPDKMNAISAAKRARRRGATVEPFTLAELYASWDERGLYACIYCDAPWEHHDHFIPLARGGEHSIANLVPACGPCNLSKNASMPDEWWAKRARFNEAAA